MAAMRVKVTAKTRKRLAAATASGLCVNPGCKSVGEEKVVNNRGLCQRCANQYRYERLKIAAKRGERAAVEYERRRLIEGSLLQAQEIRDYRRGRAG